MFDPFRETLARRVIVIVIVAGFPSGPFAPTSGRPLLAAANTNPFDQLHREIELPPMPEAEDPVATCMPIEIGVIDPSKLHGCHILLFTGLADQSDLYQFVVEPKDPKVATEWSVYVRPSAKTQSDPAQLVGAGKLYRHPIARIFVDTNRLCFQWSPDNVHPCNHQLANVIMGLSSGRDAHSVRFRKRIDNNSIVLDLTEPVLRVPVELPAWPRRDSLAMVVRDVEFASYRDVRGPTFQFRGGRNQVGMSERLMLTRADAANTQISFVLAKRGTSNAELQVRASYGSEGKRRYPFVEKEIQTAIQRVQQSLRDGKSQLASARSVAPSLESSLAALKNRQTSNAQESTVKAAELAQLKARLRNANSTIRRYSRSTPKLESSLDALETIRELGESLHGSVRLHIGIVAQDGQHSLELVRFGESSLSQGSMLGSSP